MRYCQKFYELGICLQPDECRGPIGLIGKVMKMGDRLTIAGDESGLRGGLIASFTAIVAVIVHRRGRKGPRNACIPGVPVTKRERKPGSEDG